MKSYSTNPKAIAARARRLLDPAWAEHVNAQRTRYHRAKRARQLAQAAISRAVPRPSSMGPPKALVARVAHHLARGRDVGDIAVRERIMASVAKNIVDQILACTGDESTQQSRRPARGRD